jgi:hypothetical protein
MRFAAWLALPILAGLGMSPVMAAAPAPSFTKDIKPFLSNYCLECHQGNKAKAGVTLDTYQALMKGDRRGRSLIIAGKPDNSRLLHTMEGKAKQMPPKKSQQPTAQEIVKVRAWIAAGAKDDSKGAKPVGLEVGLLGNEQQFSSLLQPFGILESAARRDVRRIWLLSTEYWVLISRTRDGGPTRSV